MRLVSSRFFLICLLTATAPVLLLYYIAANTVQLAPVGPVPSSAGIDVSSVEEDNIRLRQQLQNYHSKLNDENCTGHSRVPQCEVIHVCIVCAGYNAARDVSTVIKSLLFYRSNILHLHLLVDSVSLPILNTLLGTWDIPSVVYSFYSTTLIQKDVSWIPNAHYSGVYGLMKLQLPYVLPANIDKVILLDTDIVFSSDIAELWKMFQLFSSQQFIGLVENLSDWYLPSSGLGNWPALGRGFNTGVMLMNLRLMKERNWAKLWRQVANKYLPEAGPTRLADQDIINAIIKEDYRIVHTLPCLWNVQVTLRATFEPSCYSPNAKAIHFNSPEKYQVYFGSRKKDATSDHFKNTYFMFLQYDGNLLKHKSLSANCPQFKSNSSTTHSVISELLDRSPEVSLACYQVEGLRQSSRGRLHLYYLKYNYTVQPGDVTLVAQLSIDRLGVLELLCEHWTGPMSLALYLSDNEAQQFYDFVSNSAIISARENIGYHVIFKTGTHYPVNQLRNVALDNALTQYVFLTDIDFLPMANMCEYVKESAALHDIQNRKLALVVPAFQTQQYRPQLPFTKEQLKKYVDTGQVQIFRHDVWPEGHAPTNYSRWFNSSQPYPVSWQPNYEPYIVVSRERVPKYDERFFGFGWNKVSHIMEVDAQGFKMVVLPHAFIIHTPHAPSLDISQYRSSPVYRKCLKTLKKEFQKDLSRSYGIRALKYLSND
ncbi:xylosyl- and glucuronyltransferase LARGE2s-like [Watersipora subatra]|uniref:xylosyl- and glucuronyltransferase LARGE2s-like n=1 Tax=Watersipora subatra TaxID=2589382 RepID=UPI00355B508A